MYPVSSFVSLHRCHGCDDTRESCTSCLWVWNRTVQTADTPRPSRVLTTGSSGSSMRNTRTRAGTSAKYHHTHPLSTLSTCMSWVRLNPYHLLLLFIYSLLSIQQFLNLSYICFNYKLIYITKQDNCSRIDFVNISR